MKKPNFIYRNFIIAEREVIDQDTVAAMVDTTVLAFGAITKKKTKWEGSFEKVCTTSVNGVITDTYYYTLQGYVPDKDFKFVCEFLLKYYPFNRPKYPNDAKVEMFRKKHSDLLVLLRRENGKHILEPN